LLEEVWLIVVRWNIVLASLVHYFELSDLEKRL